MYLIKTLTNSIMLLVLVLARWQKRTKYISTELEIRLFLKDTPLAVAVIHRHSPKSHINFYANRDAIIASLFFIVNKRNGDIEALPFIFQHHQVN